MINLYVSHGDDEVSLLVSAADGGLLIEEEHALGAWVITPTKEAINNHGQAIEQAVISQAHVLFLSDKDLT